MSGLPTNSSIRLGLLAGMLVVLGSCSRGHQRPDATNEYLVRLGAIQDEYQARAALPEIQVITSSKGVLATQRLNILNKITREGPGGITSEKLCNDSCINPDGHSIATQSASDIDRHLLWQQKIIERLGAVYADCVNCEFDAAAAAGIVKTGELPKRPTMPIVSRAGPAQHSWVYLSELEASHSIMQFILFAQAECAQEIGSRFAECGIVDREAVAFFISER
jgi:hypothetical protein